MGYCPFSKFESRYSKLHCDTGPERHGLGARQEARHGRAGAQWYATTRRKGAVTRPAHARGRD